MGSSMNDEMQEILGDFLAESAEMLEALDQHFVHLESDPTNVELLNEIFRCMHSMKGSAGFLGFTHLVEVAHLGESLLNMLRNGEMVANAAMITIILEAVDIIKLLQEDIRDTGEDSHVDIDLIVTKLSLTIDNAAVFAAPVPAASPEAAPAPPEQVVAASIEAPSIAIEGGAPTTSAVEASATSVPTTSVPEAPPMGETATSTRCVNPMKYSGACIA